MSGGVSLSSTKLPTCTELDKVFFFYSNLNKANVVERQRVKNTLTAKISEIVLIRIEILP